MSSKLLRFLCAALLCVASAAFAAFETNGDLDSNFDVGKLTNGQVESAVLQTDGKLLISGNFGKVNGVARRDLARLNADGSLDTTFNPGTGADSDVLRILLQTDGKIVITGFFSTINGTARNGIARLNADGSLDTTYDPGSLISYDGAVSGGVATNPGFPSQAVLQADGKLIVVGQFYYVANGATTSAARSGIARFTTAGVLDSTYNPGTGFTLTSDLALPNFVVLQSSGNAIVQGNFDGFNGNSVPGFARINTDGSYDSSFSAGTATASANVGGLFVQADDRVIVYGSFSSFNSAADNGVVRLLINGGVDSSFATGVFQNFAYPGSLEAIAQQPDGKLVVGGLFYSIDGSAAGAVARLNTNGTRDTTFLATGTKTAGEVMTIVVRASDSRVFLGGTFSTYSSDARNCIVLTNTDGSTNSSFVPTGGATDFDPEVFAILPQADGKVIAGGLFSTINGTPRYNLARFNSNGTLDNTFGVTFGSSRSVRALATQSTGKIIVAGSFYAIDGVACGHIARLNTDGTLDTTFNPGTGTDNIIYAVAVDSTDNIYIGGVFTTVNGVARVNLAKLGSNGALDTTFNPLASATSPSGAAADIRAIAPPTASAGLVIGGYFTTYQGTTVNRIARVNATTAALDTAFTGTGSVGFNSYVRALSLTTSGQYYVGGFFAAYRGVAAPRLIRLTSTGAADTTFTPSPAQNSSGTRSLVQQNGKIDAGGLFSSPSNGLARYSSTGAFDSTLVPGAGVANSAYSITTSSIDSLAVAADGKLYIGGIFDSYKGAGRFCFARLTNNILRINSVTLVSGHFRIIGTGAPSTRYAVLSSPDLVPADFISLGFVTTDSLGAYQFDDPGSYLKRFYELTY